MRGVLAQGSIRVVAALLPLTAGLVAVAYLPGAIAPANTLRWAVISVLVPLALLLMPRGVERVRIMPGHWLLLTLLAYALVSTRWASSWTEALNGWWQLALLGGCILTGSLASTRTLDTTYRVFAIALLPSALVAILQAAHLPTWGIEQAREFPSGLFMSSQLYGEIGALGFVLAPVGGPTQLGLLLGVILSGSRAAMLAVALAGCLLYARAIREGRTRWPGTGVVAGILGIGAGLYLGFAKTTSILASAEGQLGGGLSRASALRWPLWMDTLKSLTPFGHGVGSYYVDMPRYVEAYPVSYIGRPEFAENEFLHYAFELGIPGAVLLAGIFGLALFSRAGLKPRLAVLALLVVSCLGFPLHMPATVFLGGLVLGHCLRDPEPLGPHSGDALAARTGTPRP